MRGIEKGKEACSNSPTLDEEWVQKVLGEMVCKDGIFDEEIIRNNVEKILISNNHLEILCGTGNEISIKLSLATSLRIG